jgi:hypothetical protein
MFPFCLFLYQENSQIYVSASCKYILGDWQMLKGEMKKDVLTRGNKKTAGIPAAFV